MANQAKPMTIDASTISQYLRENPDFLIDNPELLEVLSFPNRWKNGEGGNVVDLQTSMLGRMRDESATLKDATNLLISTTRSNMMIQTRTHAAIIAILGAESLKKLLHVVLYDLPLLLDIDATSICMEKEKNISSSVDESDIRWLSLGSINKILGGPDKFTKLVEQRDHEDNIFGGASGIVNSAALCRFRSNYGIPDGLLALGSRNRGAFHNGQGTDLLIFLTRVLELSLYRWSRK